MNKESLLRWAPLVSGAFIVTLEFVKLAQISNAVGPITLVLAVLRALGGGDAAVSPGEAAAFAAQALAAVGLGVGIVRKLVAVARKK